MTGYALATATIYALCEDDGSVRYVGRTLRPLKRRMYAHLGAARVAPKYPVHRWIAKRLRLGLSVEPQVLETVPPGGDWAARERYWVERSIQHGARLLNLTLGGEALPYRRSGTTERQVAGWGKMAKGAYFSCVICEARFWRKPRLIRLGYTRFCSAACKKTSQIGSRPELSPAFIAGAEAARARRLARTHCLRGHPFAGENLFFLNGSRRCRACQRARARAHYARKMAPLSAAADPPMEAYAPQGDA